MSQADRGVVGDVGGTHARFAVAALEGGRVHLSHVRVLPAADYATGGAALSAYLSALDDPPVLAVIAAAGPVEDGAVEFTNNKAWRFDERTLESGCGFKAVRLINDFTGQALAIPHLDSHDTRLVGPRRKVPRRATVAILGPGTGFGAAALADDGHAQAVVTGEAGHASFAPEDEVEIAILRWLMSRHERVSVEHLCSGPGLLNIYRALADIDGKAATLAAPDAVTHAGLSGDDATARAALGRFCAILGSAAGNLALATGARGGVYISGGIAPDILDFLKASDFRARFEAKDRMTDYLAAIPTRVVVQPRAALIGAASLLDQIA